MKVQIVDKDDNFLYIKEEAESDAKTEITRSSSVWLLSEKGEILLSKRSKTKWTYPDLWGPSAVGTLETDETYESNVKKEAHEEIGVTVDTVVLGPKKLEFDHNNFFNQYFFAQIPSETKFILNEEEVGEVRWIELEKLKEWFQKSPNEFIITFGDSLEVIENYLMNLK